MAFKIGNEAEDLYPLGSIHDGVMPLVFVMARFTARRRARREESKS
jgi:hypothetical protein